MSTTFYPISRDVYQINFIGYSALVYRKDDLWDLAIYKYNEKNPEPYELKLVYPGFDSLFKAFDQTLYEAESILIEETNPQTGKKYLRSICG